MTLLSFAPVEEELETVLEVPELLLLLVVLEVPPPLPTRRYPPTPAMRKATTMTMAAIAVETPVLERRTVQNSPGR
jgi:hypothetical protein